MNEPLWKDFFLLLVDPSIPFLRNALIAGLMASVPMGLIGCFVVTLKMSYAVGAIAHANLLGIGLSVVFSPVSPVVGVSISSFLSSIGLWGSTLRRRHSVDVVLTLLWMLGSSLGIILISRSSGYFDPTLYLFGKFLLLTQSDLWAIAILSLVVVPVAVICFRRFSSLAFDEEYLHTRGVNINYYRLIFFLMLAFVIVLLTMSIGLILVVALMSLPSATGIRLTRKLSTAAIYSIILSWVYFFVGSIIGYLADIPAGAVVVLCAGFGYLSVLGIHRCKKYNK